VIYIFFFRDLAQNNLTGDIPRLIYWNEVLQYLWVKTNVHCFSYVYFYCMTFWVIFESSLLTSHFSFTICWNLVDWGAIIWVGRFHLTCASLRGYGTCKSSNFCKNKLLLHSLHKPCYWYVCWCVPTLAVMLEITVWVEVYQIALAIVQPSKYCMYLTLV